MNDGLDGLGTHELMGFDYMALAKGAGGLLSGVADMFADGKGGSGTSAQAAALAAQQAEQRRQAEASAANTKMLLVGLVALIGGGGLVYLIARK